MALAMSAAVSLTAASADVDFTSVVSINTDHRNFVRDVTQASSRLRPNLTTLTGFTIKQPIQVGLSGEQLEGDGIECRRD